MQQSPSSSNTLAAQVPQTHLWPHGTKACVAGAVKQHTQRLGIATET